MKGTANTSTQNIFISGGIYGSKLQTCVVVVSGYKAVLFPAFQMV